MVRLNDKIDESVLIKEINRKLKNLEKPAINIKK